MKRHDLLTVAVMAGATSLATLFLAWPTSLDAGGVTVRPKAEKKTPTLVVGDVEMALRLVSTGNSGRGPVLQLAAANRGTDRASLKCTIAMLDRDNTSLSDSRSGPAETTTYTREQPVILNPGQTLTFTVPVNRAVSAGHSVAFSLSANKESLRIAGFNVARVEKQVALASPLRSTR